MINDPFLVNKDKLNFKNPFAVRGLELLPPAITLEPIITDTPPGIDVHYSSVYNKIPVKYPHEVVYVDPLLYYLRPNTVYEYTRYHKLKEYIFIAWHEFCVNNAHHEEFLTEIMKYADKYFQRSIAMEDEDKETYRKLTEDEIAVILEKELEINLRDATSNPWYSRLEDIYSYIPSYIDLIRVSEVSYKSVKSQTLPKEIEFIDNELLLIKKDLCVADTVFIYYPH